MSSGIDHAKFMIDRVFQMSQAERNVRQYAVDKERRHGAYPEVSSVHRVLLYALPVKVVVHLVVVALQIDAHLCGVLSEMAFAQIFPVLEQYVVIWPEAPLSTGRFRRFSGPFGMRMDLDFRVVSKYKPHAITKMAQQNL